jgi:sugar lactone lactonase YvrE
MFRDMRYLTPMQRRLVFFLIFGGGLMLLILVTVLLINSALNTNQRQLSVSLQPDLTVREFAALPDDNAYPPAVAVGPDGTLYTGSFASGAVWTIDPAGTVTELPDTRDSIGAVAGLAVAPDGALLVVDQLDTDVRSGGGSVARISPDRSEIDLLFAFIDDERGFVAPNDLAIDSQGRLYVSDSGRNEVWRFNPDGSGGQVWWVPTLIQGTRTAVTGLAYDPTTDSILITEPEKSEIYRVRVADGAAETLYTYPQEEGTPPGFDGIDVGPDGTVYAAALGQNGIAIVSGGELTYIAGLFRGASDVAYDSVNSRLYVPNFDQASLVLPLVQPQLPFAIDVIELNAPVEQSS